jgi:hypothetical protein
VWIAGVEGEMSGVIVLALVRPAAEPALVPATS